MEELYSYLKEHLKYNPSSGVITRNDRRGSDGSFDKDGYLIIKVKGKQFKSHRLAWFLYYGSFPKGEIDHINRIRTDNRISNLRIVDAREQVLNRTIKPNLMTGCVGIYKDLSTKGLLKRYTTRWMGKTYRFKTLTEALTFRKEHNLTI